MKYTDEGNLRFVGNTRTSTPSQVCNIYGDLEVSGDLGVCKAIHGCGDLEVCGEVHLGAPGDVCIYDYCGHDIFCSCNGNLCIYGRKFADGAYTSNKSYIEIQSDNMSIGHDTSNGSFGIFLYSDSDCIAFRSQPASEEIKFVGGKTIRTTSTCLELDNDINVSGNLNVSGDVHLGAPGDVCIYDYCGHDIFCSCNGDLCIYGLHYADGAYTSNKSCIEMENDSILIRRETNDGAFGISICNSDNLITFTGNPSSEEIKFVDGKTIRTTSTCLELDNDINVSGDLNVCGEVHLGTSSQTADYGTACVSSSIRKGALREITITWCDSTLKCDIWAAIACNIDLRKDGKGTALTSGCTYLSTTGYIGSNEIPIYACNYNYDSSLATMCSIAVKDLEGNAIMTISATCTAAATDANGGGFLTVTGWAK